LLLFHIELRLYFLLTLVRRLPSVCCGSACCRLVAGKRGFVRRRLLPIVVVQGV
jgi:hypothetical protein